jgi:PiT family inorganic phosphate transporter
MSVGHGLQDAQKTMGVITLALTVGGLYNGGKNDPIPTWVIFACAGAISLGTYAGGWRIMKTLGKRMIEMDPIRGLSSQSVASFVLFYMAIHLKAPISTTHTITSSIIGAGATRGRKWVRWGVVGNILGAWVLTLPAAALCAYAFHYILAFFGMH